jgi:hypothetical protein
MALKKAFARGVAALLLSLVASGLAACTSTTNDTSSGSCAPDDTVAGCSSNSSGYSCGADDTPDQTDPSLLCSTPTIDSNGDSLYCCIKFVSGSCAEDSSVAGCSGDSFGFSCTSTDTPDEADSSLNCSSPTISGGEALYCCTD